MKNTNNFICSNLILIKIYMQVLQVFQYRLNNGFICPKCCNYVVKCQYKKKIKNKNSQINIIIKKANNYKCTNSILIKNYI